MVLRGKCADLLNAQQQNGHEEGIHCRRSALDQPSMVLELLLIGYHCLGYLSLSKADL